MTSNNQETPRLDKAGERFRARLRREAQWYSVRIPSALLTFRVPRRTERLIVFLTPGFQWVSGGVLSIASIYRESSKMFDIHRSQVELCSVPGEGRILKYNWFKNNNYILDFEKVLKRCPGLTFLMLHVPDYAVNRVGQWLEATGILSRISTVHINVLLQNIDQIGNQDVSALRRFGKVTCTTAHQAYTNPSVRQQLGVPVHLLSTFISPEQYVRTSYAEKEPILIASFDAHPRKEAILRNIADALPQLTVRVIRNLSYEAYKRLVSRAKWSLTFGEGLDAYFIEPVFCGGVSFAVYNERFFTAPFAELETVYPSWDVLTEKIVADLKRLDNAESYKRCWQQAHDLLASIYDIDAYRMNLRRFYEEEYTLP